MLPRAESTTAQGSPVSRPDDGAAPAHGRRAPQSASPRQNSWRPRVHRHAEWPWRRGGGSDAPGPGHDARADHSPVGSYPCRNELRIGTASTQKRWSGSCSSSGKRRAWVLRWTRSRRLSNFVGGDSRAHHRCAPARLSTVPRRLLLADRSAAAAAVGAGRRSGRLLLLGCTLGHIRHLLPVRISSAAVA